MQSVHLNAGAENPPKSTPSLVSCLATLRIGQDIEEPFPDPLNPANRLVGPPEGSSPSEGHKELRCQFEVYPSTRKNILANPPETLDEVIPPLKSPAGSAMPNRYLWGPEERAGLFVKILEWSHIHVSRIGINPHELGIWMGCPRRPQGAGDGHTGSCTAPSDTLSCCLDPKGPHPSEGRRQAVTRRPRAYQGRGN